MFQTTNQHLYSSKIPIVISSSHRSSPTLWPPQGPLAQRAALQDVFPAIVAIVTLEAVVLTPLEVPKGCCGHMEIWGSLEMGMPP